MTSDTKIAAAILIVASLVISVFITWVATALSISETVNDHWERTLIEKGYGTYKDGKFEWKESAK